MCDYKEAIEKLKSLDLSTYPYDEIRKNIGLFGKFGAIQMMLHPGKVLIRARPSNLKQSFTKRRELSYKPKENNKSYQRASTPNQTMFYAGTIPEDIKVGELDNARIIASLEASHLLRNVGNEGEQSVTFSKWVITKDIPLFAVCYHKDFTEKNSHTKELYEAYQQWTKSLDPDLQEKSFFITEYLANEFAKKDIRGDYDYMISAIFTEISVNKGVAGVYYPSVRADALGFNVAILPEAVDSSLQLVAVGECTIYKKGDHTIVDNETVCLIEDDKKPFILQPVEADYHIGRDRILQELKK